MVAVPCRSASGDLAGFFASTYMGVYFRAGSTSLRLLAGLPLSARQVPIRLGLQKHMSVLTQPDGKPSDDPEVLHTFGSWPIEATTQMCMGEVVKYGLIEDKNSGKSCQKWMAVQSLFWHMEYIIYHSCDVKRKIVVEDELDNGARSYLNFWPYY